MERGDIGFKCGVFDLFLGMNVRELFWGVC